MIEENRNTISKSFENFSIQPSINLKKKINRSLFFVNLYHYHLNKLIALTSVIALIIILLTVYADVDSDFLNYKTRTNVNNIEKENLSDNNIENVESKDKTVFEKDEYGIIYEKKTIKESEFNIPEKHFEKINFIGKNNKINAANNITKTNLLSEYINEESLLEDRKNNELYSNNFSLIDDKNDEKFCQLKPISIFKNEIVEHLSYIDSGLIEVFYKKHNYWFLDIYTNPSIRNVNYMSNNVEFDDFTKFKNDAFVNSLSNFSIGFNIGYSKNKMQFTTGINFNQNIEKYSYKILLVNPIEMYDLNYNNSPYDFISNNNYYNIDTIGGYYHYTFVQDSIIHVFDSTWVNITDTSLVNAFDTIRYTKYDTLENKEYINKYYSLRIPIIVGYKLQYQNIDFTLNAGLLNNILLLKKGNNIADEGSNKEIEIKTYPNKIYTISGLISINMNYNFNENLGIFIEPAFIKGLTNTYKSNYLMSKNNIDYSLKIGIRKKLN